MHHTAIEPGGAPDPRALECGGKSVAVVGAGNIGSHLLPHLARSGRVSRITLIDGDDYDVTNVATQDICAGDAGKPKVLVQARRLRAIRPGCDVRSLRARVEDLPLGVLRADVILAAVDNRAARQWINQVAWRLGIPWIDAGVRAEDMLARVSSYRPASDLACGECGFQELDYAALEQRSPCAGEVSSPPTGASSGLGALAAALQALECLRLLEAPDSFTPGRELVVDSRGHHLLVTRLEINPECRFDHQTWTLNGSVSLDEPLSRLLARGSLRLEGHAFATQFACATCGDRVSTLHLGRRLPLRLAQCGACTAHRLPAAGALFDRLEVRHLGADAARRTLRQLGLLEGDIVALGGEDGELHLELRS